VQKNDVTSCAGRCRTSGTGSRTFQTSQFVPECHSLYQGVLDVVPRSELDTPGSVLDTPSLV
jgi:hypothetical protein